MLNNLHPSGYPTEDAGGAFHLSQQFPDQGATVMAPDEGFIPVRHVSGLDPYRPGFYKGWRLASSDELIHHFGWENGVPTGYQIDISSNAVFPKAPV